MWSPTPEEHSFAAALWARVAGGAPSLPAASAAALLSTSGLQREILSAIWTLADPYDSGMLTFPAFCYALRGVSMAQVGAQVSPEAYVAMARVPLPLAKLAASPSPPLSILQPASSTPQPIVGAPQHVGGGPARAAEHSVVQQYSSVGDDEFGDFGVGPALSSAPPATAAVQGPAYSLDDAFAEMGFDVKASPAPMAAPRGTPLESPALQSSLPAPKPSVPVVPASLPDDDEFGSFGTAPVQVEAPAHGMTPLSARSSPAPSPAHPAASSSPLPSNAPAAGGLKKIGASSFAPARAAHGGPASISLTIGTKPAASSRVPITHAPPNSPPSMSLASFLDTPPPAVDALPGVFAATASSLSPVDPSFAPFSAFPKASASIEPIMLFSALSGAVDAIEKVVIRPVSDWHAASGRAGVSAADIACAMRRLTLADELFTQALIRLDALPRSADLTILRKNEIARVHAAVDEVELLRAMTSSLQDNGASTTISKPRAATLNSVVTSAAPPTLQPPSLSSSPVTRTTPLKAVANTPPAIIINAAERVHAAPAKLLPPSQKLLIPAPHAVAAPLAIATPHAQTQVTGSAPSSEWGDVDDGFGGFSSLPVNASPLTGAVPSATLRGTPPPLVHAITSTPSKLSPNALSAFDDLLDGVDLSAPPVEIKISSPPVVHAIAAVESDDFGDFGTAAEAPRQAAVAAPALATSPVIPVATKFEDGNDDEFGSFGVAPSSSPQPLAAFSPPVAAFSPLAAFSQAPQSANALDLVLDVSSNAFGATANAAAAISAEADALTIAAPVASSVVPFAPAAFDDEFGAFGSATTDFSAALAVTTSITLVAAGPPTALDSASEADNEFGDFNESASAASIAAPNSANLVSSLHVSSPRMMVSNSEEVRDVAHQLRESRALACAAAVSDAAAAKLVAIDEDRLDDAISAKKRGAAALERRNGSGWPCAAPPLDVSAIAIAAIGPDAVTALLALGGGGGGRGTGLAELAVESLPRAVAARTLLLRTAALCEFLRAPSVAAPGAPSLAAAFKQVLSGGALTAAKAEALLDRAPPGAVNNSARVQEFFGNMTGLARFFTRVASDFAPVLFVAPLASSPEAAMAASLEKFGVALKSFDTSARALGVSGDAAGMFSAALAQLSDVMTPAHVNASIIRALASDANALTVWADVTPGDAATEAAASALLGEDGKTARGNFDFALLTKAWGGGK